MRLIFISVLPPTSKKMSLKVKISSSLKQKIGHSKNGTTYQDKSIKLLKGFFNTLHYYTFLRDERLLQKMECPLLFLLLLLLLLSVVKTNFRNVFFAPTHTNAKFFCIFIMFQQTRKRQPNFTLLAST